MQILKICIVLLLVAVAIIGAAETGENGRYKLFKRKPSAGKYEDAQGSGRSMIELKKKLLMMLNQQSSSPMYLMQSPFGPSPTADDYFDIPATNADSTSTSSTTTTTTTTTPPPNGARIVYRLGNRSPAPQMFEYDDGLDSLEDEDEIIFELEDNGPLVDDEYDFENEADDYSNDDDNDNNDDDYQSRNDDEYSAVDEENSFNSTKNNDCDKSNDSDFAVGPASRRQNEIKRQKQMELDNKLKRQSHMQRPEELQRADGNSQRTVNRSRNRRRQQQNRRRNQNNWRRPNNNRRRQQIRRRHRNRHPIYRVFRVLM